MNTKKIAYLLAFVLLFGVAFFARAADDNRYLIKTTSGVWKKYFGVRHSFDNGFTTDLSDFQIRFTKIFGIEIEPVKKLYVMPAELQKESRVLKTSARNQRILPSSQVPWGVKMIYNNPVLASAYGGEGGNIAALDTGGL